VDSFTVSNTDGGYAVCYRDISNATPCTTQWNNDGKCVLVKAVLETLHKDPVSTFNLFC